jgi:hypothetical protein
MLNSSKSNFDGALSGTNGVGIWTSLMVTVGKDAL